MGCHRWPCLMPHFCNHPSHRRRSLDISRYGDQFLNWFRFPNRRGIDSSFPASVNGDGGLFKSTPEYAQVEEPAEERIVSK